ncbi:hypothetical protein TNCV_4387871 [Trichonephila clavipes]|nr:hypothetical protein TNCV_4387871 [Trichonephila clavipes]
MIILELAISELNQNFTEAFAEASKPKFNNAPKILSPEIKSKIYQRNRLRKFWQRIRCPSIYSHLRTLSRAWRIAITPIEKAGGYRRQFGKFNSNLNHVAGRELFDQCIHDEVTNFINTPHVQEIETDHSNGSLILRTETQAQKSPDLEPLRFQSKYFPSSAPRVAELTFSEAANTAVGIQEGDLIDLNCAVFTLQLFRPPDGGTILYSSRAPLKIRFTSSNQLIKPSGKWHVTYGVPAPERGVPPHQNFRIKGRNSDFT